MPPDDRRSADHEPAVLSLLAAQHSHEFLSAFAKQRPSAVCTAAASYGPYVAEHGLGAATVRPSPDHSSQGAGRTPGFNVDSSTDPSDHADS